MRCKKCPQNKEGAKGRRMKIWLGIKKWKKPQGRNHREETSYRKIIGLKEMSHFLIADEAHLTTGIARP